MNYFVYEVKLFFLFRNRLTNTIQMVKYHTSFLDRSEGRVLL